MIGRDAEDRLVGAIYSGSAGLRDGHGEPATRPRVG